MKAINRRHKDTLAQKYIARHIARISIALREYNINNPTNIFNIDNQVCTSRKCPARAFENV